MGVEVFDAQPPQYHVFRRANDVEGVFAVTVIAAGATDGQVLELPVRRLDMQPLDHLELELHGPGGGPAQHDGRSSGAGPLHINAFSTFEQVAARRHGDAVPGLGRGNGAQQVVAAPDQHIAPGCKSPGCRWGRCGGMLWAMGR